MKMLNCSRSDAYAPSASSASPRGRTHTLPDPELVRQKEVPLKPTGRALNQQATGAPRRQRAAAWRTHAGPHFAGAKTGLGGVRRRIELVSSPSARTAVR